MLISYLDNVIRARWITLFGILVYTYELATSGRLKTDIERVSREGRSTTLEKVFTSHCRGGPIFFSYRNVIKFILKNNLKEVLLLEFEERLS